MASGRPRAVCCADLRGASSMIMRIASILFPIFAIVAAGYWYGRRHDPEMAVANRLNMDIFVPALVFTALAGRFDLLIDTVSAKHDIDLHLGLLRPRGTMVVVGVPPEPAPVSAFSLIKGDRRLAGSLIGGIQETQEMLDFCGDHNITSDIELIPIQKLNEAYERLLKSDVKYRFVIDMASLK